MFSSGERRLNEIKIIYGSQVESRKTVRTSSQVNSTEVSISHKVDKPTSVSALSSEVTAKVPIILGQLTLKILIDLENSLPMAFFKLNKIDHVVKILKCLLIHDTNTLFIEGTLMRNISYFTYSSSNVIGAYGDTKHCNINIPFKCATPVSFNIMNPYPNKYSSNKTLRYYHSINEVNTSCYSNNVTNMTELDDNNSYSQESTDYYNDPLYCEILYYKLIEYKNNEVVINSSCNDTSDKAVLILSLRILQDQKVKIPPSY